MEGQFRISNKIQNNKTKLPSRIGEQLKLAREKKNFTIKEVADSIHARTQYLECLEKGEYRNLPVDVYTQGFLKKYAEFLGLPSDEIVDFYKKEKSLYIITIYEVLYKLLI